MFDFFRTFIQLILVSRPKNTNKAQLIGNLRSVKIGKSLLTVFAISTTAFAAPPDGYARLHYNRSASDYNGWSVYTWTGAANPSPAWEKPQAATASDSFGIYFDVQLTPDATKLNYIIRNADGSIKNCDKDLEITIPQQREVWHLQDNCTIFNTQPQASAGDISKARAHFVTRDTLLWPSAPSNSTYRLYSATNGGLTPNASGLTGGESISLTVDSNGASAVTKAKFPHIAQATALKISASDLNKIPTWLKGQLAVARFEGTQLKDVTSIQIPGVLDDLYTYGGRLGALTNFEWDQRRSELEEKEWRDELLSWIFSGAERMRFHVWAPTAKSVSVVLYPNATAPEITKIPMTFDAKTGVWIAPGKDSYVNNAYYQYEVQVYVPASGRVETNRVTDPYSLAVAAGSQRSFVADLTSRESRPPAFAWSSFLRPPVNAPEDISIYELHVRDFSANDLSVNAADRGKYKAFANRNSNGMKHLRALAQAGLTHIHLLPAFDIASIPETNCVLPTVPSAAPDSSAQQAAIASVKDQDCFNWGYDPVHYTTPEGSFASNADGLTRVYEFREMVQSLQLSGLRVVMDMVYNHTSSSGQNNLSVLDPIVPGYYYRLNNDGSIANSTCCSNTATEHNMMAKLMVDSVFTWARDYHIDGFRFDLMGHQPKATMVKLKEKLQALDPAIYLYGEGWNFGEVENNQRFVQATQVNMAGTGIGTFNDRIRDGVRGGGAFDGGAALMTNQGFINGLWASPNEAVSVATTAQKDRLLQSSDWIRSSLAGSLKDYIHIDRNGLAVTGNRLDYYGLSAGYVSDPQEVINYVSAHDNQTLFDINQYRLPRSTSAADRVRVNNMGLALVALSQGIPFFHAGDDILRSKSLDRDSYNSGDWFNRIDWSYSNNNWGVGLPPEFTGNKDNWPMMQPLLADPRLTVGTNDIKTAHEAFKDLLQIRKSSPLFRLRTGDDVMNKLKFYNVGPSQTPGVIVMHLNDESGDSVGGPYRNIVVLFNANPSPQSISTTSLSGKALKLHPVQANSNADVVVKQSTFSAGTFNVPARTTAVFVETR